MKTHKGRRAFSGGPDAGGKRSVSGAGGVLGGGMLTCLRGGDEEVSRTVGAPKREREDILEWIVTGREAQRQEAQAT